MPAEEQSVGSIDWQDVIFAPGLMSCMESFAKKRFGDTSLAEEAYTAALAKLLDSDWQASRLGRYRGKSTPAGFVFSAFRMLLEDFSRQRYGRPRPPAWIKRLGPFWEKVYRLLCLERLVTDEIQSRMQSFQHPDLTQNVEEAVWVIRSRVVNCGEKSGEVNFDFQEYDSAGVTYDQQQLNDYEQKYTRETIADIFSSLAALLSHRKGEDLGETIDHIEGHAGRFKATPAADRAGSFQLALADEDKLLLRMVYQDNRKVSEVARILGEAEHKVRRRLKKSMEDVREQLEQAGLGLDLVRGLLESGCRG